MGGRGKSKSRVSEQSALRISSDKVPEAVVKNNNRESDVQIYLEHKEQALTDAGWLGASPGEIRQTEPRGGALQYVSLLALEVNSAAHLATNRPHTK